MVSTRAMQNLLNAKDKNKHSKANPKNSKNSESSINSQISENSSSLPCPTSMDYGFELIHDGTTLSFSPSDFARKRETDIENNNYLHIKFKEYLKNNGTPITRLVLKDYVSCDDIKMIRDVIEGSDIKELRFWQCYIRVWELDDFTISGQLVSEIILKYPQITTLAINGTNVGDSWAEEIAKVLPDTQITELSLADNIIGCWGATKIAEALPNSIHLNSLSLFRNYIDSEGKAALLNALKNSPHLNKLGTSGQLTTNSFATLCSLYAASGGDVFNGGFTVHTSEESTSLLNLLHMQSEDDDQLEKELINTIINQRQQLAPKMC